MTILRTQVEHALDDLISQEGGMRFQGLAVVLGKMRWPELIANQRKKDFGLDAYARADLTPESFGKGLAASITPTFKKISADVEAAKKNYPDLGALLFITPAKVSNADRRQWEETIFRDDGLRLHILEREDIIAEMMMPENAPLRTSFLYLKDDPEPEVANLVDKTRRAAAATAEGWFRRTKEHPLIDLTAVDLELPSPGSIDIEASGTFSLEQISQALLQGSRIVLEGPAGRGKTTTLIQLAQRTRSSAIPFMIDLSRWATSDRQMLEYVAGMAPFQAEDLTPAHLAKVQKSEPFLFLLNGWNEIAEATSDRADAALRELDREFPSAGIIVATRTHHLPPPLPGALQLRLSRIGRHQRSDYLEARLGGDAGKLCVHIDSDPSVDELTRTPFILSEVASLFEAGTEIPSTKIGVITRILALQEKGEEHGNALQRAPIFGRQTDYLRTLATEMTRRGAVELSEGDARAVVDAVAQDLADGGQIERTGAPAILAALTAHHVLERVDYPETAFRFDHQQYQEHYAALYLRTRLFDLLHGDDPDADDRFADRYVNDPAWAEPLRMVAASFAETTCTSSLRAGVKLVNMAFQVDLLFASELVQLCGGAVWNEVRKMFGERLRAVYEISDENYRQYAIAAMLATGADDFRDIVLPLLSADDQQTRLKAFRLWPEIHLSSLGPDWREEVRNWNERARADFVSELLHHRVDGEIASFAAVDNSAAVKKAAASGLMWVGSEQGLTFVLKSMDAQAFEEVARENPDRMPQAVRPKAIAALREFIEASADPAARLRTGLQLIELKETDLLNAVKKALSALSNGHTGDLRWDFIVPALEYLREVAPDWVSKWVAVQIAEGPLYAHEYWLPFATAIPDEIVDTYLKRLETEDMGNLPLDGMVAVIAARSDAPLAARVFARLRELRRSAEAESDQRHKFEWRVVRQLEEVFGALPGDIVAAGILCSVTSGDLLDIKVATNILRRGGRRDLEPLRIGNGDLRARLRAYLKGSVNLILQQQDDFTGETKANLASSIAQVGEPEDLPLLVELIRADIERVCRGRAAWAAGDRGPLGNGGSVSHAGWHVNAVVDLDPSGAEQALVDLLSEPEYSSFAAGALAREFVLKSDRVFGRAFPYDVMWSAREGLGPSGGDNRRRTRFAAALNAEIKRRREQEQIGNSAAGLKNLACALAAIDGRGAAGTVLEIISKPDQWDEHICVDATERLLTAGIVLPADTVFALADSFLKRTEAWMQDSDRYLLSHILALLPLVDDPVAGIAKIRVVLGERRLRGHELRELITALGESRSDAAVDLLHELASDTLIFRQCAENIINAFAKLDTPRAHEALLALVDPDMSAIVQSSPFDREDVLIVRLVELSRRAPEVARRLQELCGSDLPESNRVLLSRVMSGVGTLKALFANLKLIDDAKSSPIPQGVMEQLENVFVQRVLEDMNSFGFTLHAQASNEVRVDLLRMTLEDPKRRRSAFMLLGQIEAWRLDNGKPTGEPRHPDLSSGLFWPLVASDVSSDEIMNRSAGT